jgi:hypothetical protein
MKVELTAAQIRDLRAECGPDEVVMNGRIIKRAPGVRYPGDPVKAFHGASTGQPVFFRGAQVKPK